MIAPESVSARVAAFAVDFRLDLAPAEVAAVARRSFADCLAVMAAGMRTEPAILVAAVVEGGRGDGRVLGKTSATTIPDAALVNGVASHALDFDDDDPLLSVGHPSAPVMSALVAVSDLVRPSVRLALEAYVVGIETIMRLGAAINPSHYRRGWHATSTLGTIGATTAVTRLLNLSSAQARHALGIAASSAGGLRVNFGTMTKPLHVGLAARAAVLAGMLARQGFTANANALDGPLGFLAVLGDAPMERAVHEVRRLGVDFGLVSPGLAIKLYPSCSNTHPAIDAVLDVLRRAKVHHEEIESIECHVAAGTSGILIHPEPRTGLEAKFSMQHCLAVAAVKRAVTIDDFTDAVVADDEIATFRRRVTLLEDLPSVDQRGVSTAAEVTLLFRDGGQVRVARQRPRGSQTEPISTSELLAKLETCLVAAGGRSHAPRDLAVRLLEGDDGDSWCELLDRMTQLVPRERQTREEAGTGRVA